MPAEPEMASEPELKTPPDKRHEVVVFNPGEAEVGRRKIFLITLVVLAAGNGHGVHHVQPRLLHTVV